MQEVLIVELDKIIDIATYRKLASCFDEKKNNFILDFSNTDLINHLGIGAIIYGFNKIKHKNGKIILNACNDRIKKLFELFKINFCPMTQNIKEAIQITQKETL